MQTNESEIKLKNNFKSYPYYVTSNNQIILETTHSLFAIASDFLIAIAEPISRPTYIHEYQLTTYSLYAAVCVGFTFHEILNTLDSFSKNIIPESIVEFVEKCTRNCGKVRIVVRFNKYFLKICNYKRNDNFKGEKDKNKEIKLLSEQNKVIDTKNTTAGYNVLHNQNQENETIENQNHISSSKILLTNVANEHKVTGKSDLINGEMNSHDKKPIDFVDNTEEDVMRIIFEDPVIKKFTDNGEITDIERVRSRLTAIGYPAIEELDFRSNTIENMLNWERTKIENDEENDNIGDNLRIKVPEKTNVFQSIDNKKNLKNINYSNILKKDDIILPCYNSYKIDLKPETHIRTYQEICLSKMFSNGCARSGIIVLPCGSGKTLVGITAICTMKHPTLILCTSTVSVEQWKTQIKYFTNIEDKEITAFTSDKKDEVGNILITTYTMLAYTGKRSREAQKTIDLINKKVWGLLVLDEVHVVPANMFRKVVSLKHYIKLGLTATLVREDDKIQDLNFLIGPKLYEADWQSLSRQGHIAKVECVEIWCRMTPDFFKEYLTQSSRKRRVLSVMNPGKFMVCDYLIRKYEREGHKIIVFSDNVFALKSYALKLNKPFIYGPTGQQERMRILKQFQTNPKINCIFLSKVGDTSIDLPEATILIQINSHFGSRRQEAQRLGRILRAKKRNDPGFRVYFYSLVSKDTDEMYYSSKRQQFLVDQGYSFRTIRDAVVESNIFSTKKEQRELLLSILMNEVESEEEVDDNEWREGIVKDVSGGEGMAYIEKKRKKSSK